MTPCTRFLLNARRIVFHMAPVVLFLVLIPTMLGYAQTREDCLACHAEGGLTMDKNGKTLSITVEDSVLRRSTHRGLVCVACHVGFDKDAVPHQDPIRPVNCVSCHRDAPTRHAFHPQLLSTSAGMTPDRDCKGCHGTHEVMSPKTAGSRWSLASGVTSCGACHVGVRNEFAASAHGVALRGSVPAAPSCLSCHRTPVTGNLHSPARPEIKLAQARMCLTCHQDDPNNRARMPKNAGLVSDWFAGFHGTALQRGNGQAAACADCHGSHTVQRGTTADSPVHRTALPTTCGKCHTEISTQYRHGIHGRLTGSGRTDTPGCGDCHAEHPSIAKARNPRGPASVSSPALSCGTCHPPAKVVIKTAVNPAFFSATNPGYHGFSRWKDSLVVTQCASCHGAHDIREKTDSASAVHPANIPTTCGACHPDAKARFTAGPIHSPTALRRSTPVPLFTVKRLYVLLILLFLAWQALQGLMRRRKNLAYTEQDTPVTERLLKRVLIAVFALAALTGFGNRYPGMPVIAQFLYLFPEGGELVEQLHHACSGLFILVLIWYLVRLIASRRTRRSLRGGDRWLFRLLLAGVVVLIVTGILSVLSSEHSSFGQVVRDIHTYQGWLTTLGTFFIGTVQRRRV